MGRYFGTDGFRGEANVTLTAYQAYRVGRFLGWHYGSGHKARIVIGKDTRISSYMFEYSLVSGLTASGADVYLLHVTPTPSVAYIVNTEDFDCGIMISASHNPYYDNGIKLIDGQGHKMDGPLLDELEDYIDAGEDNLPLATREQIGRTTDYTMGRNRYTGYLMSLATRSFKGVRVGLDCANGSSYIVAKAVFDALGATTYVIHNTPDGTNINRDCGSTHIKELQRFVREESLDVGFAFDGDADRCLCVDDRGEIVDGDKIMYLTGVYMKKHGQLNGNKIVTTVMSNLGLYKALDRAGIGYEKTQVGDKYVYENMCENHYSLGGEQSGHIIFSKYATTGDGILTALKIMEVMLEEKTRISALLTDIVIFPQKLINVRVVDKDAALADPDVVKAAQEVTDALGSDGRLLLRKSGTEPLIRVMVEAPTDECCSEYAEKVAEILRRKAETDQKR